MATPDNIAVQRNTLASFLPKGGAWPREIDSFLMKLVEGLGVEFADVEEQVKLLIEEADPYTTLYTLADWERALGLPDECSNLATTIQERRLAVVAKYLNEGGQSKAYFQALAQAYGYTVTIEEFRPFVCGFGQCGVTPLMGGAEVRFYWRVKVTGPRATYFRVGVSQVGTDPLLKISRAEDLECIYNKLKPAHTILIFAYEGA
jgi:uncharacterized protein YmfQ (DUF2313 family)